jgi:SpoVK/Ycf46/Vps4 family AAA+-type ATPase
MGIRGILVDSDGLDESTVGEFWEIRRSHGNALLVILMRTEPKPGVLRKAISGGGTVVGITGDQGLFTKYRRYFNEALGLVHGTSSAKVVEVAEAHGDQEERSVVKEAVKVDVGDLLDLIDDSLKSRLVDYVDSSLRLRDMLTTLGLRPVNSILLIGPSGVGKSLLVNYVAEQLGVALVSAESGSFPPGSIVHIPNLNEYGDVPEVPQDSVVIAESSSPWELGDDVVGRFGKIIYVPPPSPRTIEEALGKRFRIDPELRRRIAEKLGNCRPAQVLGMMSRLSDDVDPGVVDRIDCEKLNVQRYVSFINRASST